MAREHISVVVAFVLGYFIGHAMQLPVAIAAMIAGSYLVWVNRVVIREYAFAGVEKMKSLFMMLVDKVKSLF